jgi:hypothetical protein
MIDESTPSTARCGLDSLESVAVHAVGGSLIWAGAAVVGVVGLGLAVPVVGLVTAAHRHWCEYRDIEAQVAGSDAPAAAARTRRAATTMGKERLH